MHLDKEYDQLCHKLENELENKVSKINTVCEVIDNLNFKLDQVRFFFEKSQKFFIFFL